MKSLPHMSLLCALTGVVAGAALSATLGARTVRDGLRAVEALAPEMPGDALSGLTRLEARSRLGEARGMLEDGRPWAAWSTLEPFVREPMEADAPVVLLAARSAATWTGWREVRTLLRDQPWLESEADGEGLYLLGRGEEGGEEWGRAAAAYTRYVQLPRAERRAEGWARLARMRVVLGDPAGAAAAYQSAAQAGGPAADWFHALAAEAAAGTGASLPSTPAQVPTTSAARVRLALAEARMWQVGKAPLRAAAGLGREAEALAGRDPAAAAGLDLARARLLLPLEPEAARAALVRAASAAGAPPLLRAQAAGVLGQISSRTAADERLRADAYEAARKPGQAARALRAALRREGSITPGDQLRIGRLLWDAVDLEPARTALLAAAEMQTDPELRAEAELLAARVLVRQGKRDEGISALKRVAMRNVGTPAAGEAWFYLGDLSTTAELGIANYRRAAAVERSPRAAEALWRLGDRLRRAGNPEAAAAAWGRLASAYPGAPEAARAGYEAGRIHESAGRSDAGAAAYHSAIRADPLSYYAVRAADRLGVSPLRDAMANPVPWQELTGDPAEVAAALARLDALMAAGATDAWREEMEAQRRALDGRAGALLALAEGIRDRGHAVEAIRIARTLHDRTARWDARLLRVVFPLPQAGLLRQEADRVGLDPHLLAGLIRQESSWNPLARSRVGATGLAQVMPATGRWLAPSAGVREFRTHLLTVPEVGLRMGARYLRDQMKRYDGRRDLALAAYNAGPGRADRWRRELARGRDVDAFREAIPFDETRDYVKLVIRNAEIYRQLYGGEGGTGLVHDVR